MHRLFIYDYLFSHSGSIDWEPTVHPVLCILGTADIVVRKPGLGTRPRGPYNLVWETVIKCHK